MLYLFLLSFPSLFIGGVVSDWIWMVRAHIKHTHTHPSYSIEADVLIQHVLSSAFTENLSGAECVSTAVRRLHAQWVSHWPTLRVAEWHSPLTVPLTPTQRQILTLAVHRRTVHEEPLAYLTGTRHFWSHLFWVQTHPFAAPHMRAFIPRPETELVRK
jgi:methylase of polypeptide subunit release factors